MSEKPESAKIYQFSDAIDEHLDSSQATLIAEAQDFTELAAAIEKIGVIQGTQKLYTGAELENLINQLRSYSNTYPEDTDQIEDYLLMLPRMFGLRTKVESLLKVTPN